MEINKINSVKTEKKNTNDSPHDSYKAVFTFPFGYNISIWTNFNMKNDW